MKRPRLFASIGARHLMLAIVVTVALVLGSAPARSATGPAFQYNILSVQQTAPGLHPVVKFSVTDPTTGTAWDIKHDPAFTQTTSGASRLFVQIGWDTRDYTNTGSGSAQAPVGAGAALPIAIDAIRNSVANGDGTYTVTSPRAIPSAAIGTGVAAMEGHPAAPDATGAYTVRLPVKSVYAYFTITVLDPASPIVPRRTVVDVAKCKGCHGTLTLHGNNRTDEPKVCVICHNPNNTDITQRQYGDGPETPIDFKRMVHAIHAAKMRHTPFVVIGFNHSVNDFSKVVFPAELSNCLNCHVDKTFELPLGRNVLGTTVATGSLLTATQKSIDGDPTNDVKITPTAAVCSACHDSAEVRQHMQRTGGASFATTQQAIDSGAVVERCVRCHGPGKDKDVRKVHLGHDGEHGGEHDD